MRRESGSADDDDYCLLSLLQWWPNGFPDSLGDYVLPAKEVWLLKTKRLQLTLIESVRSVTLFQN